VSESPESRDADASGPERPEAFLRAVVAPTFNRQIEELRQQIAALERELDERTGVEAAVALHVIGDGGGTWYLNVRNGCMEVGTAPAAPVVFSVYQSAEDWVVLAAQGGSTPMAGPAGKRGPLTRSRIARLRSVSGTARLVLRGESEAPPRTVTLHFGPNAPADPPQVILAMREEDARRLREGSLDPQAAFLQGLVTISGDMGLALQIGTALFM
jgi:hypothetical protein